ncbi:MAG TPA: GNAT family N-acetyltransferase [Methylotenera sp.]|nr:GNAT family N-acetyltransferase [Methylotenera sp.]
MTKNLTASNTDKPETLDIVAARITDIAALNHLLNQCADAMAAQGMQHWLGVYDEPAVAKNLQQKRVYTLRDKQQIVACVALSNEPADYYVDCWPAAPKADYYLTMLAVTPDCQQRGFGKLMVQFCQQQVPNGYTLQLDAVAHYPTLLDFYRRLGFQQIHEGIGLGDKRCLFSWSAE